MLLAYETKSYLFTAGESMLQIFNVYKVVVCVVRGTGR